MARRASYCHLCNITNQSETPTGYVNGKPIYGTVTISNVPCRFYRLKGLPEQEPSGAHIIEVTKVRFALGVDVSETSVIIGLSQGFDREYRISGLPETVYNQKKPVCIECYLKSVDGVA